MSILANFAVLEGGDGSGTTTQLGLLRDRFAASPGLPPLYPSFEPTEGPLGKLVREALRGELRLLPETLARLFAADRNEHLYGPGGLAERCARGELAVSDRYVLSSLVYQGLTCGEELPGALNEGFPLPEALLFFDLDGESAQRRMEGRPLREIYETLEFQLRVRDRYRALLPRWEAAGVRVSLIDASKKPEKVAEEVWRALEKMPIMGVR
jgi:dTMP kinase